MGFFTDTKFDSIDEMLDCIDEVVERNVKDNFELVSADKLGLDIRAGYRLYVNADFIAVYGDGRSLDYYGGFEYVDRDYVKEAGGWRFYSREDSRVDEHISYWSNGEFKDQEQAA